MYFHSCLRYVHQTQCKKKVEPPFNSLHSVGSGLPVSKILKNKPHLFVFGNKYSQASLISDIRTNIRELSRFTETDKRKLAFFSIKNRCLSFNKTTVQKYKKNLSPYSSAHNCKISFRTSSASVSHAPSGRVFLQDPWISFTPVFSRNATAFSGVTPLPASIVIHPSAFLTS